MPSGGEGRSTEPPLAAPLFSILVITLCSDFIRLSGRDCSFNLGRFGRGFCCCAAVFFFEAAAIVLLIAAASAAFFVSVLSFSFLQQQRLFVLIAAAAAMFFSLCCGVAATLRTLFFSFAATVFFFSPPYRYTLHTLCTLLSGLLRVALVWSGIPRGPALDRRRGKWYNGD